jgi:hypothetical protein
MPGWRRSADGTHLQGNTLPTGNFTSGLRDALLKAEVTVLQRLLDNPVLELTGKIF